MKSEFLTSLSADHLEGKWWRIRSPLVYYSESIDTTITVPEGFVLDFASVPRLPLAYMLFGNTKHWEAAVHDLNYRWGIVGRITSDIIFHESMAVRSRMRENQSRLYRFGRFLRRNIMTSVVIIGGVFSAKSLPGCLDYRNLKECENQGYPCKTCENYYPNWEACYLPGYRRP